MELSKILERVEKRLGAVGLSASAASKAAGKTDAIQNMRRAVKEGGRVGVSTATLNALAPVLQTTAVWLFAGAGAEDSVTGGDADQHRVRTSDGSKSSAIQVKPKLVPASHGGLVEAGAYRPVDELNDYPDVEPQVVEQDELFPFAKMVTFDVAGDSMNALKPRPIMPGDRIVCVDYEASISRLPFKAGMVVVVERTMNGGHLRERSVKQLEIHDNRFEFHPRSSNRKHEPIVVDKDWTADDGTIVRVIAIVRRIMNEVPL